MNQKIVSLMSIMGLMAAASVGASENTFERAGMGFVSQKPQHVFVPTGFDDNDNSQVVLDGVYPNTCYTSASPEMTIDHETKTVQIKNRARLNGLSWCAMTLVPYTEVIDLGQMGVGNYTVLLADDTGKNYGQMGLLKVGASRVGSQPDEFLYAPVEDAFIKSGRRGGAATLIVRGTMTNTCMKLKNIEVRFTDQNVVEVIPYVQWVDRGANCATRMVPFETKVSLKGATQGRTLIHVRSLNGKAINKVVDL